MKRFTMAASFAAFLLFNPYAVLVTGSTRLFVAILWAEEPANLGEITVQAPAEPGSAEKSSAFVSVINPKPFENQLKSLTELLSQQPGINVQQFGGLGQLSNITIRGSTSEQVTVFIDGMKLNTAQGSSVDFSTIPLDTIDRIEIIRGGASAQFGSDAIGGAINIITKKTKKKQNADIALSGGSFGTFKATGGYSRQFEKFSILLDYTHSQSEGDFTFISTPVNIGGVNVGGGVEYTRENNAFFSENGMLKIEGDPSARVHFNLMSDWFGTHRGVTPTEEGQILRAPDNPPRAEENVAKNYSTFNVEVKSVAVKDLNLRAQSFLNYEYSHFSDPTPLIISPIDVRYFNYTFGAYMAWSYPLKTGPVSQNLKFSYTLQEDIFNEQNLVPNGPSTGSHDRTTNGLYFSDELSFWEGRLQLNPSARFENTNDFGSRYALHLGILANPLSWLTFKSNVDNAFRYPNFNELFFPNEGIIRGNPDLIPEEAIDFDIGFVFRHRFGREEIGYFLNRIDNSIIFLPITPFTIAPINTERVNGQGIEFSTFLSPWSHLDLDANFTLLDAHLLNSGNQLPGRPKYKVNAKVSLKNKWGSLYATLQYIDKMPIDLPNTTFINQRAQVDVGGTLKIFKHYYFGLELKDVNNVQMVDARGFPLPRRSIFGSFGAKI